VYCPATTVYESVSYYFGVDGVIIPDTAALGIQAVKAGSPAERVGLQPGMLIVAVNGQSITGEAVMVNAIQQSGGRLDLLVLAQGSDQPQPVTVILDLVRHTSY
jgi:C-terminal processing protease CtpA/Prc